MKNYTLKVTLNSGKTIGSIPLSLITVNEFGRTLMQTSGPIRIPLKTGWIIIGRAHVVSVELIEMRRSRRNNSQ